MTATSAAPESENRPIAQHPCPGCAQGHLVPQRAGAVNGATVASPASCPSCGGVWLSGAHWDAFVACGDITSAVGPDKRGVAYYGTSVMRWLLMVSANVGLLASFPFLVILIPLFAEGSWGDYLRAGSVLAVSLLILEADERVRRLISRARYVRAWCWLLTPLLTLLAIQAGLEMISPWWRDALPTLQELLA